MIEVVIAVAIVTLLAAIAIPGYRTFLAKSRQAEAKDGLESLYILEKAYHGEKLTYGTLADIGFVPEGAGRYTYCVTPESCVTGKIDTTGIGAAGGGMGAAAGSTSSSLGDPCGGGIGTGGSGGGSVGGGGGGGPVGGGGGSVSSAAAAAAGSGDTSTDSAGGGGSCGGDPSAVPGVSGDSSTGGGTAGGSGSGTPVVWAAKDSFYAIAAGRISQAPAPNDVDKWSIDDRKTTLNFAVGY